MTTPKAPYSIAGLTVEAGQRLSRVLDLILAGTSTQLPLFVINGAHPGKTVVITGAIHGSEYVGTAAAMRIAKEVDPATLRGQLVIAPVCSMTAFKKRAIYIAPPDTKNLNRCFPGSSDGSFAEQLAHWLFDTLIKHADFYLDLHGGDMNEALAPFSIIQRTGKADLDDQAMQLARVFGLQDVVTSEVKGSTIGAAAGAGIPAVLAEVGGQGLWSAADVDQMHAGLQRALNHAGLTTFPAPPAPATRILEEMSWLRSEHDGFFYPGCAVGESVKAGQVLGHVDDYLGNTLQTAVAPHDGTVLFLVTTMAMNKGEPLLSVGA
jgi:predicted deacylase